MGSGRPEGSLACVARCERSALRAERVCSRVDFLVWRDTRRGLEGVGSGCEVVVVVVLVCELFVDSGLSEEDGGSDGGFVGFVFGDS